MKKIKTNIKNKFNTNFTLNDKQIIAIKHDTIGKLNNLSLEDLLKNIKKEDTHKIEIKTIDIFYNIKINNKEIERKEKIIFLITINMRKNLANQDITNFF